MIVFAGPSLAGVDAARDGIVLRPPAKQGDLYLATLDRPRAIGLIDGYFAGVPAVWHKEILWALSQGIPVLGASSMGALRAAELDVYGMIGVGAVYEGYRDGLCEDDDEVALIHAPEEMRYAPLSIALVNIRATCALAVESGIITAEQGAQLISTAQEIHYPDRTWPAVLAAAELECDWMSENTVDQKQIDAAALLDRMSDGDLTSPSVDEPISFHFEHTSLWRRATAEWRRNQQPREIRDDGGFRLLRDDQLLR